MTVFEYTLDFFNIVIHVSRRLIKQIFEYGSSASISERERDDILLIIF